MPCKSSSIIQSLLHSTCISTLSCYQVLNQNTAHWVQLCENFDTFFWVHCSHYNLTLWRSWYAGSRSQGFWVRGLLGCVSGPLFGTQVARLWCGQSHWNPQVSMFSIIKETERTTVYDLNSGDIVSHWVPTYRAELSQTLSTWWPSLPRMGQKMNQGIDLIKTINIIRVDQISLVNALHDEK